MCEYCEKKISFLNDYDHIGQFHYECYLNMQELAGKFLCNGCCDANCLIDTQSENNKYIVYEKEYYHYGCCPTNVYKCVYCDGQMIMGNESDSNKHYI